MKKLHSSIGLGIALVGGLLTITPKAFAGEGGIAGSASFVIDPDTGG